MATSFSLVLVKLSLEEEQKQQLVAWNAEKLQKDFKIPEAWSESSVAHEVTVERDTSAARRGTEADHERLIADPGEDSEVDVDQAKVAIVFITLFGMYLIMLGRLLSISSSSNFAGYMVCLLKTITERTWVKYVSSLHATGHSGAQKVVDAEWMYWLQLREGWCPSQEYVPFSSPLKVLATGLVKPDEPHARSKFLTAEALRRGGRRQESDDAATPMSLAADQELAAKFVESCGCQSSEWEEHLKRGAGELRATPSRLLRR